MALAPGPNTVPLKLGLSKGGMSRSSPSLHHSRNLRNYSLDRKRIPLDRPISLPHLEDSSFDETDLVGGNGAWRRKKAVGVFEKRRIAELEQQERDRLREREARRRRCLQEERRLRQQEDERRELMAHREAQIRERREKEEQQRKEVEREQARRRREEREWLAKQPKTCETCSGSGKCASCEGTGTIFATFLASKVCNDKDDIFGRVPQGCAECGGYRQNIMANLQEGTGICPSCKGEGKIWPEVLTIKTNKPRFNHGMSFHDPGSPLSPMSPFAGTRGGDRRRISVIDACL